MNDPIIKSLLDNDLYKFTMQNIALKRFADTPVEYKFILRSKNVNLAPYISEIRDQIHHLCTLKVNSQETAYLRSLNLFSDGYLEFLQDLDLSFDLKGNIKEDTEGGISLRFKGNWFQKILFEVPLMAIISEVYLKDKINTLEQQDEGYLKLYDKIKLLDSRKKDALHLVDFGTRRRFSREWHDTVVSTLKDHLKGTSNLYLARKHSIPAIGTMAHEYLMLGMSLSHVPLKEFQKYMLREWIQEYKGKLGIALTDTINSEVFFEDFDYYLSKVYDGCRHDSGDPFKWGDRLIQHYEKMNIDPLTKTAVFSDGLDFQKMFELEDYFKGKIKTSYGIGTNLTNDTGVKPLSMVIKLVYANNRPLAKISDEPIKAMCEDYEFLNKLKKTFLIN